MAIKDIHRQEEDDRGISVLALEEIQTQPHTHPSLSLCFSSVLSLDRNMKEEIRSLTLSSSSQMCQVTVSVTCVSGFIPLNVEFI
ncbi:hypothetical protein SAY86_007843 [Trapa natans]|uniref:Uncharacterized protein n=1 Tax=Trapa natans TaxID=22666 RepID=A0AAN7QXC4_TRANT|nr:hypothetical protein SAY86_007843 [Trapa natans]